MRIIFILISTPRRCNSLVVKMTFLRQNGDSFTKLTKKKLPQHTPKNIGLNEGALYTFLVGLILISLPLRKSILQGKSVYEPSHDKPNKMTCAPSEDSDQPGHPPSLIRGFAVCMKKHWVLSYLLSPLGRL